MASGRAHDDKKSKPKTDISRPANPQSVALDQTPQTDSLIQRVQLTPRQISPTDVLHLPMPSGSKKQTPCWSDMALMR